MGQYRGDSVGKKIARDFTWRKIISTGLMSPGRFKEYVARTPIGGFRRKGGKIVVLASGDGGDIGCLLSRGFTQEDIIACDIDKSAIDSCREKYPNIEYHNGCVSDIFNEYRYDVRCVNLDLCSKLTHATDRLLTNCVNKIDTDSVVSITVLKGRESNDYYWQLENNDAYGPWKTAQKRIERIVSIFQGYENRRTLVPIWSIEYNSTEESKQGSPMLTMIFVAKCKYGNAIDVAFDLQGLRRVHPLRFCRVTAKTSDDLKKHLVFLKTKTGDTTEQIAESFGVNKKSIIAMHAHATRKSAVESNSGMILFSQHGGK